MAEMLCLSEIFLNASFSILFFSPGQFLFLTHFSLSVSPLEEPLSSIYARSVYLSLATTIYIPIDPSLYQCLFVKRGNGQICPITEHVPSLSLTSSYSTWPPSMHCFRQRQTKEREWERGACMSKIYLKQYICISIQGDVTSTYGACKYLNLEEAGPKNRCCITYFIFVLKCSIN